ncbi:hypothetical protein GCM10023075_58520 [Streptosporangium album]
MITGPESITHTEQVRIIGEAIGREVRWEDLLPLGLPGPVGGGLCQGEDTAGHGPAGARSAPHGSTGTETERRRTGIEPVRPRTSASSVLKTASRPTGYR